MTELEIMNFALDFSNLIRTKNAEIGKLKSKNDRLEAISRKFIQHGVELTLNEVRSADRPVFVYTLNPQYKRLSSSGCWAVPKKKGEGVLTARGGTLFFSNYGMTWVAYTDEMPEEPLPPAEEVPHASDDIQPDMLLSWLEENSVFDVKRLGDIICQWKLYRKSGLEPCDYAAMAAYAEKAERCQKDLDTLMQLYMDLMSQFEDTSAELEALHAWMEPLGGRDGIERTIQKGNAAVCQLNQQAASMP